MISDVLRDAIEDIEDYQKELPVLYDPVRDELQVLTAAMRRIIHLLNDERTGGLGTGAQLGVTRLGG